MIRHCVYDAPCIQVGLNIDLASIDHARVVVTQHVANNGTHVTGRINVRIRNIHL